MKLFTLFFLVITTFSFAISQNISGESEPQSFNVKKIIIPPVLVVKQGSINFSDENQNGRLDAYENAFITFVLQNNGKGPAIALSCDVSISGEVNGLNIENVQFLETIAPGKSQNVSIPIKGMKNLSTGKVDIEVTVKEPNGLDCDPFHVDFHTLKFQAPKVELVDGVFSSDDGRNVLQKKIPAKLNLVIQNTGQSKTEGITVEVNSPVNILALDGNLFNVGSLSPGQSSSISYSFIATSLYNDDNIVFNAVVKEGFGKYGSERDFFVSINQRLESSRLVVEGEKFKETKITKEYFTSDVDRDVPKNLKTISYKYALVIGNEDYSSKQTNLSSEVDVKFARNDANSFQNYLTRTLGFEKEHVIVLNDATSGEMSREIEKLVQLGKLDGNSEIVFYYAGHGLPDDNKRPYLLPVDVSTINLKNGGISLKELYSKLASSNAEKITVFLDACFSGGGRDLGVLSARGVKIRPKEEMLTGNMIVFASSSGEERSLPFEEKKHGFFTYFLLKKLKETNGVVNYGELSEYTRNEVMKSSLIKMSLLQTPRINISSAIEDQWQKWRFR